MASTLDIQEAAAGATPAPPETPSHMVPLKGSMLVLGTIALSLRPS